jgi:Putative beta-barrel porin 2
LFDNTVINTDFDRSSGYAHYELQGARTTLTANLGITRVTQSASTITGPLAKLELSRQISPAAKLIFTAGRDVTDASSSFSGSDGVGGIGGLVGLTPVGSTGANNTLPGSSPAGIGTTPAAATSINYTITYATASWEYVRNRTTFRLSGRWEKDSYDGLPQLNVDRGDGEFAMERRLTRALSAELSGSILRTDYSEANFGETYGRVGGGLTYRAGRGLEVRFRYEHTSRIVSGAESGSGYAEDRAFLTIGYRPDPKSPTT